MKVKLTSTQNEKLKNAFNRENSTKEQFIVSRKLYEEAMKARNDIFDMITDAHSIDVKNFDLAATKFENGELVLTPKKVEKQSTTIKKALKKVK
jgi:hypothetical protein